MDAFDAADEKINLRARIETLRGRQAPMFD